MFAELRQFYNRVKRTIEFLPIVWKGFDFDYGYAIELFQYQLQRTAEYLNSSKASTVEAKRNAHRILTAVTLMDKVYNDEYDMTWIHQIQQEYGENVLDVKFKKVEESEYVEMIAEYESWENAEEIKMRIQELSKLSREKQARAERLLWQWINHNIRYWWD